MNIRNKLNVIIFSSFLVVISITTISYTSIDSISHSIAADKNISLIQKNITRLLVLSQDYVIRPKERIIIQWRTIQKRLSNKISLFHPHDSEEEILIKTINKNIDIFESLFIKLIKKTKELTTIDEPQLHIQIKNALIGRMHVVSQIIIDATFKLEKKRRLELSSTQTQANLTSAIFITLLTIIIILVTILIRRNIIKPIDTLHKKIHIIRDGDFGTKLGITSSDEIGLLAQEFDKMTSNLKETTISRDNLEQHVKQRTEELYTAKKEAETANNAKSEFLSSMSHELRTPMNAILGFAQILELDDSTTPLSDEQKLNIKEILDAGTHLFGLITQVLDLTKIESGKLDISLEAVNIVTLLNESISLSQSAYKNHSDITFNNKVIDENIFLEADPLHLKQIIINILSNAIKYNNKYGSVIIDSFKPNGNVLRICFMDTGNGIDEDKLHLLFQPFERLQYKNGDIEGTGIGLHISKTLIEHMDGKIGAESTVGKGSTFWIELPISKTK